MIATSQCIDKDIYSGTAVELISAGIVRLDQFPPVGKWGISYSQGKVVRTRCRVDETYLRIVINGAEVCVWKGVSAEESNKRKAVEQAAQKANLAAFRAKEATEARLRIERARRDLKHIPKSADAFRRNVVEQFTCQLTVTLEARSAPCSWTGYFFDADSVNAINISFDALVEAVMNSTVVIDQEKQNAIVLRYQNAVVEAAPDIKMQVTKVCRPSRKLLAGELA